MRYHGNYFALLVILSVALFACAKPVKVVPDMPGAPYTTAVLPPFNATSDIDGPQMIRELVAERLKSMNYRVKPLPVVDRTLRDKKSVLIGEQLEFATPQSVAKALEVDWLVYLYVLNFEDNTVGADNVKRVRAGVKIVDAATGRTLWANGLGVKGEVIASDSASVDRGRDDAEGLERFSAIEGIKEIPGLDKWTLLYRRQRSSLSLAVKALGETLFGVDARSHLNYESTKMLDAMLETVIAPPERAAVEEGLKTKTP